MMLRLRGESTITLNLFNNPTVKRAIAEVAQWGKKGLFTYGGRRGDSLPMFTNGECDIWFNSSAYYGGIKKQAQIEFGQAMSPYYPDVVAKPQNSIIGGATLWVLKGHPWPATQAIYQSLLVEDAFGLSSQFVWLNNFKGLFVDDIYLKTFGRTIRFSILVTLLSMFAARVLAAMAPC